MDISSALPKNESSNVPSIVLNALGESLKFFEKGYIFNLDNGLPKDFQYEIYLARRNNLNNCRSVAENKSWLTDVQKILKACLNDAKSYFVSRREDQINPKQRLKQWANVVGTQMDLELVDSYIRKMERNEQTEQ